MNTKKLITLIVSVAVLLVSVVVIWRTLRTEGPRYNPGLDECLGAKLGDATAKLLEGYGEIVVISWANSSIDSPVIRAQLRGFQEALDRHPGLKVLGHVGPVSEEEMTAPGGIPKPLVERAMALHPQAKALVSFLGVPVFDGMYGHLDPAILPAVVALSLGEVEQWRPLLASDVPAAVVRNRHMLEAQATLASQLCEDYLVVSNADQDPAETDPPTIR